MSDKIKVGIKVRPLIAREKDLEEHWIVVKDGLQQIEPVSMKPRGDPFIFDYVFTPDSTNREVFEILVKPIVQSAVRGFNGTIFAYGQTSSGKTYTMMGDKYELGIIPLAVDYMFKEIENSRGREYLLRVAYMEIYNERINDLLKKGQVNLKVNEDSFGNVVVKDLTENIVNTPQMCMDFMKKGEQIRKIGETNMNDRSSRSHTIFRVIIESREAGSDTEDVVQVSHLNLVDLAGSERAGATGAVGERLKEGCAINKSLFMLSHVIAKLSDGEQFVNFRDSRLTRILQSSLGGNALTAIICAVTPASSEETLSTLGFASRARNIKNTAQVNEVVSDAALLKRYARQINKLKSELEEAKQSKNGPCVQEMESKLQEQEERNRQLQERLDCLKEKLIVSNGTGSDEANEQRMKTLRRRTWTAPSSLKKGRTSLQAFTPPSSFLSVPEELFSTSSCSWKSSPSSEFGMPLEEFEKDLLRRCPSPVLLEEEEENEEPLRLDSRFVSTRRGRSSVRSSNGDWESKPMEDNERSRSGKDKGPGHVTSDYEGRNVNILTEDNERLKEENERFKKEIENERETAQATIVSLEETVQNQADQIVSLKAESVEFALQVKSEKEAAQTEIISLRDAVRKQADQIETLKAKKEEFVTQVKSLKSENEEFMSQVKSLKSENEELMMQMESLKAKNEEFVTSLRGLKTEDAEFVMRVESLKAENKEFATQINSLKTENEELASRIRSEKVDEEAKISSLQDLLHNQADQITSLIVENEAFVLQVKSDREDAEAKISSLRETVNTLECELEAFRSFKTSSSVVGEETPKTKLRREFTEELNELKDFTRLEKQTYNEDLVNAVERLQKELHDRVEAESELKSKLELLTERCSDLEKVKEDFDIVRRNNLTEVDLKVLLRDSNKTIAQLNDTNKELRSEVEEAKKQSKNTEILQKELETLRKDLAEMKHTYQESEKAHKSQLARMKDLEEERSDFDLKMDVIKKQFVRREQELTNSLEEAWDKLKAYESGDQVVGEDEVLLRKEVEKLKAENAKYVNQIDADQEEKIKLTETVSSLERQLSVVEDGALLRKEIERLEVENANYANQIDIDQEERIKELTETVNSLERQLSIFRSSNVTQKGRLSTLYVLEEEPSIGELSDEVYGLRTENRQYKLRISDLEELKDEYQQQIATLMQQLEVARASLKFETVKYSNKAVDVSRENVSYSECDVTLRREDSELAALLAEINELQRLSNVKTEENLDLRAALERLSKEVAKQEKTAQVLNKSFINESNLAEALNRSFIDESNSAEAEEYVTCTEDTLATTSKSSCSVLSLEKMNPEDVEARAAEALTAKLQSVDEDRAKLGGEVSLKSVEKESRDEVKDICIKRKHESVKDVPERIFKDEYEGDVLDDVSIPTSCDISFVDETATPDLNAKRRRVSTKFAASPRYQQDSPINEISSFDELKEANSCLEAELDSNKERIAVLLEEISDVRNQLSGLHCVEKERERLQQVLEDKDKHIADVEAEVLELRASQADARKLKEDLAILESNIYSKNEVIQELEAKVAMIEEELRRQGTEDGVSTLKLQKELCELESTLSVKSEHIASMEKEMAQLESEVTNLRLVANDATKLREDLAMSKSSCESKEGVIVCLEKEINLLKEELVRSQDYSSARNDLVSKMSELKEEEDTGMQEIMASLREKLSSLTNVQRENDLLEEKIAGLQEKLAVINTVKEERDQLLGEVASLQERIATTDALAEERDQLVREVAILQGKIATLETMKEEKDRLLEEVATVQEKISTVEALKEERDRLVEEVTTLQGRIATTDALGEEKDQLVSKVAILQGRVASVEDLKEERDRLVEEVATLQGRIASVEVLKEERDRLAEEVATLQEKIDSVEALKEERDRLAKEITILREGIATTDALAEERDRLISESAILQGRIASVEDLKEERDRLAEEVTILREKIATIEALAGEKDQSFSEVPILQEKIATVEALKEERDRLVSEVAIRQEKIATLEGLKEERDRLVGEIATLQERMITFEVLKEEKARLLEEVMELRLNSPNPSKSHDIVLLNEENDSKMRRTILLERENALLKERLSLSAKTADELGKDFDADQWEDQVISVRRQIVSLQENVALDVLKQEKERLEEKLAKESAKVAQIEADFEVSCSNLEKLKEDNKFKAEKIKELEEEIVHISTSQIVPSNLEEISRLQEQLQIKIEKITAIEEQLAEARDSCLEISKLRDDLVAMEKENYSMEDKIMCLEGELATLKERLVRMEEEPKDQSDSKGIASLQEEVLTLRHKISFLSGVNEENERLEKEVEESLAVISNLKAELSELRVVSLDMTSLKEELASLEKQCSAKNDKLVSLEAEVVGFKLELVRCEAETNAQKELISKLGNDVEAKREEIVSFEEKMFAAAEEKECLQTALDEKIEEITRLGSELAELKIMAIETMNSKEDSEEWQQSELKCAKENLCLKESELKSVNEDFWQKESELKSVKEDFWQKESELKLAKEDLWQKESELKSTKEDLWQKESELNSAKEDLWQKESELKSAKEDLWQKESELKSMQEDLCLKENELKSVQEDLSQSENELKSVKENLYLKESELTSVKEDLNLKESERKSVQEDLCLKENELKSVQEDLCQRENELKSVKENLYLKESELTSVKEDLNLKESDLKLVKEDLNLKESELKLVREDLSLKESELSSVTQDLWHKESELKSVREDLCMKEDELESLKSGAVSMESSYKNLKGELNEKERRLLELESDVKVLEEKTSTVVLLEEEKRRIEEEMESVRSDKDRLQEELQLKTERIARFEVEVTELQMKAADAVKLQEELKREVSVTKDELAAKGNELESLKIEINRLSPLENMNKALKCELNESKKKVSELESSLAELREKVAVYDAGKEVKDKLVKELEIKSKELEDQVIMVKYLEDRVQSKKDGFDSEKVQLKKTMAAQIEKYAKENETLKSEAQSLRKFITEHIESADPEKDVSDIDDIEDLVACLIASIKKSKSKHFVDLKEKFKAHLTELTVKLKRSEASEKDVRQRLDETEATLKKYKEEVQRIGDLEKTLTAMSDRTNKFESDLETARSAEAACLKRLQRLSCVADGCVDTCLKTIEELLLAKADQLSEETLKRSTLVKTGRDKHVQTDLEVKTNQHDGKLANETNILELRRLKIELSEKEENNGKLSTKVAELTNRCEECTVKISSLERLLSDAQETRAEIVPEAQTESLLSKLSAKESLIEELQQQLRDERSKSWMKSPMRGSYSAAEDEYKQRVELLSKELKKQTQLAESLAGSLEEQRRLYSESVSKAVVAAERKETARLKEECEQLKDQLSTITKAAEALQSEKRTLATQLADARQKLQAANNTSDSRSLSDTVDSVINAEALSVKQQVKEKSSSLQEEVNKKNAEIEELKERVKELDWECEEVATELRKTRSREEKFYDEVEESAKTIKKLQQVEQDLNKALTQKQQELSAALSELEERKENEKSQKSRISPLVPKGQLWHLTDLYRPGTSAPKDSISSHLLSSKIVLSENVPEGCQCDSLRQQIKTLRTDLSDAKGRTVELEMELKRQNYPFKKKIEVLEGEIKYLKNANSELRADNRRLQNTYADTTVQGCETCRMRLQNMSSVEVQTEGVAVRDLWLSGKTSGIVEETNRVMLEDRVRKLQKENGMLVTLCKERLKVIKDFEAQLKRNAKSDDCQ